MRTVKTILITSVLFAISECDSPRILTRWNEYHQPFPYNKIMVAAVISAEGDSMRTQTETSIAHELGEAGYNAVSSIQEFGPKGLSGLEQQETYLKLCNRGIDAVLIIALIDGSKEKQFKTRKSYRYPHNYYYNRVWNYKNIKADISGKTTNNSSYFWEAILFNLNTLEAECTIQSDSFSEVSKTRSLQFSRLVIKKMISEKVLVKKKLSHPRAF